MYLQKTKAIVIFLYPFFSALHFSLQFSLAVQRPRGQIADAEALFALQFASTFVTSVRSLSSEGIVPSDFITA
jgi:hypothetical protein